MQENRSSTRRPSRPSPQKAERGPEWVFVQKPFQLPVLSLECRVDRSIGTDIVGARSQQEGDIVNLDVVCYNEPSGASGWPREIASGQEIGGSVKFKRIIHIGI